MELRSLAKCGSCGASPSVRLKPTAVRVIANPTASETGRGWGWNQARHGLQNQALTQVLVSFSQGTAKPSHNRGQRKGPENTLFKCSVGLWKKEQRQMVLKRNFRPPFPGNGKISLETVKTTKGKKGGYQGQSRPPSPPPPKKRLKTKM